MKLGGKREKVFVKEIKVLFHSLEEQRIVYNSNNLEQLKLSQLLDKE